MGVMANKNSTSLPIIFKLPFSWFSVCLSFVNIWLFSRVLTVYSDNIACVFFFFFDVTVGKQSLGAIYSFVFIDITLITDFTDPIYMQLASVICDQPELLYLKPSSLGFISLPFTLFPPFIVWCIIVYTISTNRVFTKYWPVTNLSTCSLLY